MRNKPYVAYPVINIGPTSYPINLSGRLFASLMETLIRTKMWSVYYLGY